MTAELLRVRDLDIGFPRAGHILDVVSDLSFDVARGESVALVGESGCGKSVTARALLRLLPDTARLRGSVHIEGQSVLELAPKALRTLRLGGVGFVFQDPMTALNPVYRIGEQIAERLRRMGRSRKDAARRAVELLDRVGIPAPGERARAWPHELSGGMRQRVVIAIALAGDPALLIADEPTTALDVTIQAQIMSLLSELQRERQMGLLLITHDLGVVAQAVSRVLVMYAGRLVESAPTAALFQNARHPYARGLLRAVPGLQPLGPDRRLWSIEGRVPAPEDFPVGCRFAPRCPHVDTACHPAPIPWTGSPERGHRCLRPQ